MAFEAERMENVQIAISDSNDFLHDLPSCFQVRAVNAGGNVWADRNLANVFSHKKSFFADGYSEVLKVTTLDEFAQLKQRLLSLPIYMQVRLERRRRFGKVQFVNRDDFVIMVNTKQAAIQAQLRGKLDEVEALFREGQKFAVEIDFGPSLQEWFKSHCDGKRGRYKTKYSRFCITNFKRRSRWFSSRICWYLFLPICIFAAPIYCACRAILSNDSRLKVFAIVTHIKGLSPTQRAELQGLVNSAYAQGFVQGQAAPNNQVPENFA